MSDQQWTQASDGSIGVFPGESGMVGTVNSRGCWALWMPRVGVRYDAQYWGRVLQITNVGSGEYDLIANGIRNRCRYADRWAIGTIYDANGNEIPNIEAADVPGNPSSIYFNRGFVIEAGPVNATAQTTQPAQTVAQQTTQQTPMQQQSGAPDPQTTRTRSSDGRTDVYAGDSGMVGMFDRGRNAWYIFMPPPGIEYVSFYWGGDIAMRNNGDGTYWLDADGVKAKRMYSGRWKSGVYYDRNGRQVASPAEATAQGDPADLFFAPGGVVEGFAPTTGATTAPLNPQPQLPVTGGDLPIVTGGGGGGGWVVPDPAEFPEVDSTAPGTTGGQISGKIIALALAAGAVLLS